MKKGETHTTILIDRPIGSIVNLAIDNKSMAFRLTKKLETVEVFPGGHGKSKYECICIATRPLTESEILKLEDTKPKIRAGFRGL